MSDAAGIVQPQGNTYDKYNTRNPIARLLMSGFLAAFDEMIGRAGAGDAYEIGCGEGELTRRMARRGITVRGCDVGPDVVAKARDVSRAQGLDIPFEARDIREMKPERDVASLIVCCEVLEHLDHPGAALDILASLARPWLLTSVPREPIWRVLNMARGKYLGELGNTPGHVQHWSGGGFLSFVGRRFDVVAHRSPLPWTVALCRVRD
jgi:2-polyprenyl-3-methyl-5-hydroxy-6-metoxy-1,4-benzoquinol methylase